MILRVLVQATVVASGTLIISLVTLHRHLSSKVSHSLCRALSPAEECIAQSIPDDIRAKSDHYDTIYDRAAISVPSAQLPKCSSPAHLLTIYLQRNMALFARFPQAYLLRLATRSQSGTLAQTFQPGYVRSLAFTNGDIVCGVYHVLRRTPSTVEFAITLGSAPTVAGRLSMSIEEQGARTLFVSETVQWKRRGARGVLSLDVAGLRWMHELGGWWSLVSGTRWLLSIASAQR